MNMGTNLHLQGIEIDLNILYQGLKDGYSGGKTLITTEESDSILADLQTDAQTRTEKRRQETAESNKKEGDAFLVANRGKEGVVSLPSGLQFKVLIAGNGPKPTPTDMVVCNYRGTLINGQEFDSSFKRGQRLPFRSLVLSRAGLKPYK